MKLKVTVKGTSYDVDVEILDDGGAFVPAVRQVAPAAGAPSAPTAAPVRKSVSLAGSSNSIVSPVGGTIVEVKVNAGDKVKAGQPVIVIEAMKMQTPINATADATVKDVKVKASETVREGQVLIEFE